MAARLGRAAKEARLAADLTLLDVATVAGVGQTTVHRFENEGRFRLETDEIVAAYAQLLELDPSELWRRALERPDP